MDIGLFEDEGVNQLAPVALVRPAFAVSCCGWSLWELAQSLGIVAASARPHLNPLVQSDYAAASSSSSLIMLVNARLAPSLDAYQQLKALIDEGQPAAIHNKGKMLAQVIDAHSLPSVARSSGPYSFHTRPTEEPPAAISARGTVPLKESSLRLLEYPHDLIRHHLTETADVLKHLARSAGYKELIPGVFTAPGAKIHKSVVTDTTAGPILIEENATVGPFCFLRGPVRIGKHAKVIEHAAIKDHTQIGDFCKVGGEIESCILEPYSNKQHFGFLGHSYVGSWVNLGAGTTNSDLKNTYGAINMRYAGKKVPTGMQFMGAVIGDYAKTAINTSIFTGKTIGVGSMVYGNVTGNVPSFVNFAKSLGDLTGIPIEVAEQMQKRMFARRNLTQRPLDQELLAAVHELTEEERDDFGVTSYEPPAF
jgi:glucose-1-phosphate thymidylyltransferase